MSIYHKELWRRLKAARSEKARRKVTMWYVRLMATGTVNEDTLTDFERDFFDQIKSDFEEWKLLNGLSEANGPPIKHRDLN